MWKEGKTLSHPLIFRVTPILQKRAGRSQPFVPQMRGVMVSTCNDGETPARPSKAPVTPPGADRRRLLQTANRLKPIQQERLEALLRLGPVLREISIFHISAAGKLRVRPSFDQTECSDLGGGTDKPTSLRSLLPHPSLGATSDSTAREAGMAEQLCEGPQPPERANGGCKPLPKHIPEVCPQNSAAPQRQGKAFAGEASCGSLAALVCGACPCQNIWIFHYQKKPTTF